MQAQEIVLVFCQPHLWLTLPTVGLKTQGPQKQEAHGSVGLQAKYIIKYFNIVLPSVVWNLYDDSSQR